jgi:hypothetical protein
MSKVIELHKTELQKQNELIREKILRVIELLIEQENE